MSYFQDLIPSNHCFGCGSNNAHGLQIKSCWLDENCTERFFTPRAHHCAEPLQYVNGGILGALLDCRCICTAIAQGYKMQNREMGGGDAIWYITGSMEVAYLKPTPISETLRLTAEADDINGRRMNVKGKVLLVATVKVLAVQVEGNW